MQAFNELDFRFIAVGNLQVEHAENGKVEYCFLTAFTSVTHQHFSKISYTCCGH